MFCLLANFLWSEKVVDGFFCMRPHLGYAIYHMQFMCLEAYGGQRQYLRTQVNAIKHIFLLLCFLAFVSIFWLMRKMFTTSYKVFASLRFMLCRKDYDNLLKLIIECLRLEAKGCDESL